MDFMTQERIGVVETRKKPRITLSRFLRWLNKELVTPLFGRVHIESDEPKRDSGRTTLNDFTDEEETEEDDREGPSRKCVYVPAMNAARTGDDNDSEEGDDEEDESEDDELRNELLTAFADATEDDVENVGRMFGDVIDEISAFISSRFSLFRSRKS